MMRQAALLTFFAVVVTRAEDLAPEEGPSPTNAPSFRQINATDAKTTLLTLVNTTAGQVTGKNGVLALEDIPSTAADAAGNLLVSAKYEGNVDDWTDATRTEAINDFATVLGVPPSRVQIRSILTASVIVVFFVDNGLTLPPAPIPTPAGGDDGLSGGAIAGIVIGCVLGAGLIAFLIVWFVCCQGDDKPAEQNELARGNAEEGVKTGNEPNAGEDDLGEKPAEELEESK